jgi:hypothetical protein
MKANRVSRQPCSYVTTITFAFVLGHHLLIGVKHGQTSTFHEYLNPPIKVFAIEGLHVDQLVTASAYHC